MQNSLKSVRSFINENKLDSLTKGIFCSSSFALVQNLYKRVVFLLEKDEQMSFKITFAMPQGTSNIPVSRNVSALHTSLFVFLWEASRFCICKELFVNSSIQLPLKSREDLFKPWTMFCQIKGMNFEKILFKIQFQAERFMTLADGSETQNYRWDEN